MQDWTAAYEVLQPNVQVGYTAEGSGKGITHFAEQLTNFGETDVPLQASDLTNNPILANSSVLTIPISASAVVPAYNILLTNGTYCQNGLNFTGTVLANIFLGTITTWNNPQIANLQSPSVAAVLPSSPAITVVHRSDSSGTMYAFTDYLCQASSAWEAKAGPPSKTPNWPVGLPANLNAGVAAAILQNQNSIGPLEIAYALQNPGAIYYGNVQNAAGVATNTFITPSVATAQAALAAGATMLPAGNNVTAWETVSIIDNIYNNAAATNAYPITTMTYALLYQNQDYAGFSAAQAAATVNFLHWVVSATGGQTFSSLTGYVPLPANIIAIDDTTLASVNYNGQAITIIT
jgi:phosphate transport system substrate-binding protein